MTDERETPAETCLQHANTSEINPGAAPEAIPAVDGDEANLRPFNEFRDVGLLWLVNVSVFHPRGYALSFGVDDDENVTGWRLMGDGTERWAFAEESEIPDGRRFGELLDDLFRATKTLMP